MHGNTGPSNSTPKKHSQFIPSSAPTGWILVVAAVALLFFAVYFGLQQRFWVLSPAEKLEFAWNEDLKLLQNSRHGPLLQKVREIKMRATAHSPAQDWLTNLKPAVAAKKDGDLILDVFLVHQIEGYRYGVIMQYALLDAKTGNMVDEFARTLWLGIYY